MIVIGEKINGAIPSTAKAIANKDADFIRDLAIKQTVAGVDYIDVCASVDDAIELETMKWLIDIVQAATDLPIAVDSPNIQTCIEYSAAFFDKEAPVVEISDPVPNEKPL